MKTFLHVLADAVTFHEAILEGYISERKHDSDPSLRVYSYTPKTQYSGRWTPETRLARGLMLRITDKYFTDAEVVGRGLPKFFTIEQTDSDWGRPKLIDDDEGVIVEDAPVLSWTVPAFVADKMNGALGLAYVGPDGLAISTKGSFSSNEAKIATRWLRENLDDVAQARFIDHFAGSTALFEIITPERPHPVDYGVIETLFFLGAVEHSTGRWTPADENSFLVAELGFQFAPRLSPLTLQEAVLMPYRVNTEGLVVTLDDANGQHLYKVKPAEYLALRKAFYATETVDMAAILLALSGEDLEVVTASTIPLPVGLRDESSAREKIATELLTPLAEKLTEVRAAYLTIRGEGELPNRGLFARDAAKSEITPQLLFSAYDEERTGVRTLATHILRSLVKGLKQTTANK